jgi:hypothetical protein
LQGFQGLLHKEFSDHHQAIAELRWGTLGQFQTVDNPIWDKLGIKIPSDKNKNG